MRMNGRRSSFSSEDELPLKYSAKNESDWRNCYDSLCRRVVVDCEFCDRLFNSRYGGFPDKRYQSLIHNATHIIIPLINQTVLECEECRFCFTSAADLQRHTLGSHPMPTPTPTVTQPRKIPRIKMRSRLQFEDDPVNALADLNTDCSVAQNRTQERIQKKYLVRIKGDEWSPVDREQTTEKLRRGVKKEKEERRNPDWCMGMKDDSVRKRIGEDLPYNGEVNGTYLNGDAGYRGRIQYDCFSESDRELGLDGHASGSVPYEELRRPLAVRCKHCKQKFKNRFDLVVHQATHLRIDRRPAALRVGIGDASTDVAPHPAPVRSNHTLEICDLCYKFLQPRAHRRYVRTGTISHLGERLACRMCARQFFELNVVTRSQVLHPWRGRKRRKRVTNDQRLKNIRIRLKIANKIMQMYPVVSFGRSTRDILSQEPGTTPPAVISYPGPVLDRINPDLQKRKFFSLISVAVLPHKPKSSCSRCK